MPTSLGDIRVSHLVLDANHLEGTLPRELANNLKLRYLGLGHNSISGTSECLRRTARRQRARPPPSVVSQRLTLTLSPAPLP